MRNQNRRKFLSNVMVAGGGAAAMGGLGSIAHLANAPTAQAAGDGKGYYYVFAYFGGGWDTLLTIDPRNPAMFNDENVSETRIMPAYDQLAGSDGMLVRATDQLTFGPYIGDIQRHANRMTLVRGMSMETLSHDVGRRRFLTGKPPSGLQARGSSASAYLASKLGADDPIPNLSVRVEQYNRDLPNYASAIRVNSANDMISLLRPSDPVLPQHQIDAVRGVLNQEAECERARHSTSLRTATASRLRAEQIMARDLQSLFDFRASTPEMDELRMRYGVNPNDLGGAEAQAAIAAQAITKNVSRVVSIQPGTGLDTHFLNWTTDQGPRQQRGFNALSKLADHLSELPFEDTGESLLDRTMIVAFSEFMRTPMINQRGGRDHWLTNSCMVLGGPQKGNMVIGGSSDVGMSPQPVDITTGRLDQGGEIVRPEHVLRTLMCTAGYEDDYADLRVEPLTAMLK